MSLRATNPVLSKETASTTAAMASARGMDLITAASKSGIALLNYMLFERPDEALPIGSDSLVDAHEYRAAR